MKISILTATYNRGLELQKLYESLVQNSNFDVSLEWLIMDDGSTDDTKVIVQNLKGNNNLTIKYFYQKNMGKMTAINNLISYVSGDLIIECDSDDYLKENAIRTINLKYSLLEDTTNIYALAFLKYNEKLCNIGSMFRDDEYASTMFDLYFKDGLTGDKCLVFIADVRKKYSYILEDNEKFITEARMFNEMDKNYKILCFNQPIMICKYLEDGYSSNIIDIFKENPYGYYEYFKQLFDFDMNDVLFSKRLYIIKHYILFCYLTKQNNIIKNVKGKLNKFLVMILLIPGYVKAKFIF